MLCFRPRLLRNSIRPMPDSGINNIAGNISEAVLDDEVEYSRTDEAMMKVMTELQLPEKELNIKATSAGRIREKNSQRRI